MNRFCLTLFIVLGAAVAYAAPGDKRPAVTSAAIGLGTSSNATLASITATTSVTAPTFTSSAADGYHYVLPYNSVAFAGTPSIGMFQTTPTGPAWYSSDGWEFLSVFPVQTGNSGKFLTTDGSSVSWATVSAGDSLPSQTGNNGKFLTTNGTAASWGSIAAGSGIAISTAIPTETGAANLNDTTHILTVASATGYTQFTGTHTAWDTTPAAFAFTDETDVAISTAKTSNAITVAGTNYPAAISVTGDTGYGYSKNSAACTATSGTVASGDTVSACVTSSGSNSTATTATVTIGGVSDVYSVTTVASSGAYIGNVANTAGDVGTISGSDYANLLVMGRIGGFTVPGTGSRNISALELYGQSSISAAAVFVVSDMSGNEICTTESSPITITNTLGWQGRTGLTCSVTGGTAYQLSVLSSTSSGVVISYESTPGDNNSGYSNNGTYYPESLPNPLPATTGLAMKFKVRAYVD